MKPEGLAEPADGEASQQPAADKYSAEAYCILRYSIDHRGPLIIPIMECRIINNRA